MKKSLLVFSVCSALCGSGFAQLMVNPNGNVAIQTTQTPLSTLSVGSAGNATIKTFIQSNDHVFRAERTGTTSVTGTWIIPIEGNNIHNNSHFSMGLKGRVYTPTNTPANKGRAFGVYGEAGNSTSGYNYAVFGNLRRPQNGAAIVGAIDVVDICMHGLYAGYFQGDVHITGNLYGTLLSPSASSSASNAHASVASLSADEAKVSAMSVTNKLAQLSALQYNITPSVPAQRASAFPQDGDTLATAAMSVTDQQALEKTHFGLDAQELKQIYPDLVYESQEGDLCINYMEMIPLLIQSIKELRTQIAVLKGESTTYQVRSNELTDVRDNALLLPALEQNDPNPFTQNTVIRYTLPETVKTAHLYIYDMAGTQIEQIPVTARGKASVSISAGQLKAGMYLYSLIADGKVIDTKRMIVNQ